MNPSLTKENASITLVHVDVPIQRNMWVVCGSNVFLYVLIIGDSNLLFLIYALNAWWSHDCGIYVLKYMDTWDGSIKWQDKTMPDYSYVSINLSLTKPPCQSATYFKWFYRKKSWSFGKALYVNGCNILKMKLEKRYWRKQEYGENYAD